LLRSIANNQTAPTAALAQLPAEDREACQKLWADVAALPKRAQGGK
jgi:hypothetical protein